MGGFAFQKFKNDERTEKMKIKDRIAKMEKGVERVFDEDKFQKTIKVQGIQEEIINVDIEGITPILFHAFPQEILEVLSPKSGKAKIPVTEAEHLDRCMYWMDPQKKTFGFPADGFKKAMVRAGTMLEQSKKMAESRGMFFVQGKRDIHYGFECVEIQGQYEVRRDFGRNGTKGICIVRPSAWPWKATVQIKYISTITGPEILISMLNFAGYGVGVGAWRPEKNGDKGRFRVCAHEVIKV
jgi:hypothetical protein